MLRLLKLTKEALAREIIDLKVCLRKDKCASVHKENAVRQWQEE